MAQKKIRICPVCGESFSTDYTLVFHIYWNHSRWTKKNAKCPLCHTFIPHAKKKETTLFRLKRHLNEYHGGLEKLAHDYLLGAIQ